MATGRVVVAVTIAVLELALSGPALALPASGDGGGRSNARGGPDTTTHSNNFAGYLLGGGESSVTMNTTVVLPKLKCAKANEAIEPGTGAYYPPGAITDLSTAGMFVGCHGGTARYYPAFTLNAVNKSYPRLKRATRSSSNSR